MIIDRADLLSGYSLIEPHIHRTPLLTSSSLDEELGTKLFFKCENFQRTGSFKIRGATHAIMRLPEQDRARGVVAHSSGNFAQALALAAQKAGVPAWIAMPTGAAAVKRDAAAAYGAKVVECEAGNANRQRCADQLQRETEATFVHPSNQTDIVIGQGTAAIEFLDEVPDLDCMVVPVGGGGLIAGCALAASYFSSGCRVIGAEPAAVDDAFRSLASGRIEQNESANTIADGLKTELGDVTFPIIRENVERIIRVTEPEIISAMRTIWQRLKIVVEPSAAVAFAAVVADADNVRGKKIGILLSGGNVDLDHLPW